MNTLDGTSLGDYGHPVFKRDGFVCVYCGFDGNGFDNWRQLGVNRLRPASAGGGDSLDNLVTACNFCRSATSRMKFSQDQSAEEILESKKKHVAKRLKSFHKFWSNAAAPRDAALTPEQGGTYLPHPLVLDFGAIDLTDDQLLKFCSDNDNLRFELTAKRELVVMPPVGLRSGWEEGRLFLQLTIWADRDGTGIAFTASAGFTLPNGAIRAPDASWTLRERLNALEEDDWRSFAHICPDFVLELRSASETLASQQAKMEEYIQNGVRLGWLVDPIQKRVHVYRPGTSAEVLNSPSTVSGDPVMPGFELNLQEIW